MTLRFVHIFALTLSLLAGSFLLANPSEELIDGFHIELSQPEYTSSGMVTTTGGIVWSEQFRLQAHKIRHFLKDGHAWIEASGDLMLFYQGRLLVGDHLLYDLSDRSGVLQKASIALGGWYATCAKVHLNKDQSIRLDQAKLSTDPTQRSAWNIQATSILIRPKDVVQFKNITFRIQGLPLLYVPKWSNKEETFLDQPLQYDVVWKGSRKRKAGMRYRFYNDKYAQLWARLEYHIGKGPGIGLDGKFQIEEGTFETSNLLAKDSSITNPNLQERYRFKGHYHRNLSPTATFDIFYDKYSDPDTPKDYAFTPFDLQEAGHTRLTIRDGRAAFIHQITERIKFNSFQTVKRELPSYFLTLHPLYSPRSIPAFDSVIFSSHWRAEYLSYDFQDRHAANNYHSSRLYSSALASYPFSLSGFQFTPSLGWMLIGYNQTPQRSSSGVVAPTGNFHAQTQWYSDLHEHLIVAYSTLKVIGDPKSNVDEHYIFDSRDAIAQSTKLIHGLRQEWYDKGAQKALLQLQTTRMMTQMAENQPHQYYDCEINWLPTPRWLLAATCNFATGHDNPFSCSVRTENTWSDTLASSFEYRERNATSWKKNSPDNFGLEAIRSVDVLKNSSLSDPHKTILTHINYRMTPNWVVRLDTAHGWDRGLSTTNQASRTPQYQQYSIGVGTDLGSNWRLQFQIEYTVRHQWEWRMRLDLRDGPVIAPTPRF